MQNHRGVRTDPDRPAAGPTVIPWSTDPVGPEQCSMGMGGNSSLEKRKRGSRTPAGLPGPVASPRVASPGRRLAEPNGQYESPQ